MIDNNRNMKRNVKKMRKKMKKVVIEQVWRCCLYAIDISLTSLISPSCGISFSVFFVYFLMIKFSFNTAYWHRKYHSGTICKGVSNPQSSKALSVCEKEEIPRMLRKWRAVLISTEEKTESIWKRIWMDWMNSWKIRRIWRK